jgi:hypothetical protein
MEKIEYWILISLMERKKKRALRQWQTSKEVALL